MTRECDVAVVGGGVAGLSAAIALARLGLSCVVLEARTSRGDIDRGDVLHASALTTLSRWECDDLLHASGGLTISRFRVLDERGRLLIELDTMTDADPPAALFILRHADIEDMLERAAVRTGTVTIRRGARCRELLEENGRIVGAVLEEGHVRAPLTLLATGAGSGLRQRYFEDGFVYRYSAAYYNLQCDGIDFGRDAAAYVLGRLGVLITAPLPGGQTRLGFQVGRREPAARAMDWASEARRRLATFPAASLRVLAAHRYSVSRSIATNLWHPGVALVGDAAHTTHPAGAQGMNLAIRDAEILGQCLRGHPLRDDAIDAAVAAYEAARRPELVRALRMTHWLGVAALLDHRLLISLRNLAIARAGKIRVWRTALMSQICWGT